MPVPKILHLTAGRIKQLLTIATSAGASDAEKIPSTNASGVLDPSLLNASTTGNNKVLMTNGSGQIDPSTLPAGVGAATATITASENLTANDLVNIWNDGGTEKVRRADATTVGKECSGYVLAGVSAGSPATVYFTDRITGLSGKTPGARQYLSTTPGAMTQTPPSATGNVVQFIGLAYGTAAVAFYPSDPIELV